MKKILIRADASREIGIGHVMRCLALAQGWQDYLGGKVFFVLGTRAPTLENRLIREGIEVIHIGSPLGSVEDASKTALLARENGAHWIVVDGYHFGAEYQKTIKDAGLSLLFIDDYGHTDHYYADIVLNQNIYADMSLYKNYEPYTRFLLGAKYALLRREFLAWTEHKRDIPDIARKVLITFGGSDPDNVTLKVIEALKKIEIDRLDVITVVGGVNQNYKTIRQSVKERPGFSVRKDVNNMPELMAWADVAISAGGSTCWELVFMGLPSILCPVAENQMSNVRFLKSKGLVKCIRTDDISNLEVTAKKITNLLISHNERNLLSQNMKRLVVGEGSRCIFMHMGEKKIQLRRVKKSDCKIIWEWVNDPVVRNSAFRQDTIPWNEHEQWFKEKISNPNCIIFILSSRQKKLIGQIRFDVKDGNAEVDVSIDKKFRECGMGSYLIMEGVRKFVELTKIFRIHAHIKSHNITSIRSFEKSNFKITNMTRVQNFDVVHMIWERV